MAWIIITKHTTKKTFSVEMSVTVSEEKMKLEIKKNKITRILYVIGGTVSLTLAILGIVVPGLPVTPLALLSAFLYAKVQRNYITGY